jgi:hypothetical protein
LIYRVRLCCLADNPSDFIRRRVDAWFRETCFRKRRLILQTTRHSLEINDFLRSGAVPAVDFGAPVALINFDAAFDNTNHHFGTICYSVTLCRQLQMPVDVKCPIW